MNRPVRKRKMSKRAKRLFWSYVAFFIFAAVSVIAIFGIADYGAQIGAPWAFPVFLLGGFYLLIMTFVVFYVGQLFMAHLRPRRRARIF